MNGRSRAGSGRWVPIAEQGSGLRLASRMLSVLSLICCLSLLAIGCGAENEGGGEQIGSVQQPICGVTQPCECGNGTCDSGENASNCGRDCPCGNMVCNPGDSTRCPLDCSCGNGVCDRGETFINCGRDCTCGNGVCGPGEDRNNCPQDCTCGNGTCGPGETFSNCRVDCGPAPCAVNCLCGNGACDGGETNANCPADCKCGNGVCDAGETRASCPIDCKCGNGVCDATETITSCPADCRCGNGVCDSDESHASCPSDCTCGNTICEAHETPISCPLDCTCGNTVCESNESIDTCPADCSCGNGECGPGESHASCAHDCEPPVADPPPPFRRRSSVWGTGTLQGTSSVSRVGAYEYPLPLPLPPGRAGMEPKLALHYNSNAGNSHLGVGWSLSGTSQIRRCREVLARDGRVDGINFQGTAFCLDGEPLVPTNGTGSTWHFRTAQGKPLTGSLIAGVGAGGQSVAHVRISSRRPSREARAA